MKFFKKGIAYNDLAKSFNAFCLMLTELKEKISNSNVEEAEQYFQELYIIAFVGRNEIIEKMNEFNWSMNTPIVVPALSNKRQPLAFAFQHTIGELTKLSDTLGILEEINEILDKKSLYYQIEELVPTYLKNLT